MSGFFFSLSCDSIQMGEGYDFFELILFLKFGKKTGCVSGLVSGVYVSLSTHVYDDSCAICMENMNEYVVSHW